MEPEPFACIPLDVLNHPELNGNDVRVYAVLVQHRGPGAQWVHPSIERIAKLSACSIDTVTRSLRHLAKVNAVQVRPRYDRESRSQLTNDYRPTVPPPPQSSEGVASAGGVQNTPTNKKRSNENDGLQLTTFVVNAAVAETSAAPTPGQQGHRLYGAWYDEHKARFGMPPVTYSAPQLIRLVTPFFKQGRTHDQLLSALGALERAGRPFTRQTIDAMLKGTATTGRRNGIDAALSELRFDANGNVILQ